MDEFIEKRQTMKEIIVIGGGLAGSEAALQIASKKIKVKLYEMKPVKFSDAHSNKNFGEIVCSNSFKSNLITNACGLLKEELRILGSFLYLSQTEYLFQQDKPWLWIEKSLQKKLQRK